ncbi:MAG: hypothetical protein K6G55_05000 [Selenomonadaceae bacterium]|nr:hypothetical protein [Selenomonadaceae bacterium]
MEGFNTKKFYPLRPIQRWLVDTHFNKAKSTMMNIGALLKLSKSIDMNHLAKSINYVLNNHDIFRCRFVFHPETSDLCQIFDGEITPITVEYISDEEFSERIDKLREPYRIINKPLWRIYLFQTPTSKYMFADFYHAVMDGVSSSYLFWREVDAAYRGRKKKIAPASYAAYVEEELNISPEELAEGHTYWKNMLAHFDKEKHLPPVNVHGVAAWTQGNFEYVFKKIFNEFFRRTRINEDKFFLAATMIALAKITGTKEALMSHVNNGRTTMSEKRLMGLMLEQIPCAWDFHEDLTVGEFLSKLAGQIYTGEKYRKSLDLVYNDGLEDDCVSFIFQKNIYTSLILNDTPVEIVYLPPNEISAVENALDVEINIEDDGRYSLYLDYDASRYSEKEMENFAVTLDEVLKKMQNVDTPVSKILD